MRASFAPKIALESVRSAQTPLPIFDKRSPPSGYLSAGTFVAQSDTPPKRHHFIPQMMLRHFADDDGRLWFWRRDFAEGDVHKTTTQNLFVEKDLYTLIQNDGTKDVALETFFSSLEGAGATFINQLAAIVRAGELPKLDDGAWRFWGQFFYYHLKRTPAAIAFFANEMNLDARIQATFENVRTIRAETGGDPDEVGLKERIRQNAIVTAQRAPPSPEVLAAFEKMGLAIYRISDTSKSFIVSDAPGATAKFRMADGQWSHPTLFLPLTWDIAVGQLRNAKKAEIVLVDRDQVRRMNQATTARSSVIAGRSDALISSLSRSVIYRGVEALENPTAA